MKRISFHGVPRSGTTWLGAIFDSSRNTRHFHQPLFSYSFKSFLDENSSKIRIDNFFEHLFETTDEFVLQKKEKENGIIPDFLKSTHITHMIYKETSYHNILNNLLSNNDEILFIGIIRNPKSVLTSWYNAPKEFDKEKWDFSEEWKEAPNKNMNRIENFFGYNKWKEAANIFLKLKEEYPERIFLLSYEELVADTKHVVTELFKFCDLKLEKQTLDFLEESQTVDDSKNAYSVYRKKKLNLRNKISLPSEVVKFIDNDLRDSNLSIFNK